MGPDIRTWLLASLCSGIPWRKTTAPHAGNSEPSSSLSQDASNSFPRFGFIHGLTSGSSMIQRLLLLNSLASQTGAVIVQEDEDV